MKTWCALLALFVWHTAVAAGEKVDATFLDFSPVAKRFTQVDAERLAGRQFQQRFGDCGRVIFKERKFEAWIFETRIGYGGVKGPDIVVFSTSPSSPDEMVQSLAKTELQLTLLPQKR